MARNIRWSENAYRDFDQATKYIAVDSESNAAKFAERVIERVDSLLISAEHHAAVPEWNDKNVRETFIDRFRLIYKVTANEIRIIGLVHGSRDLLAFWLAEQRPID